MKSNKIIIAMTAISALFIACDDEKWEWALPEGHTAVTSSDIPSAVKEVIANYDDIKTYAPGDMTVGVGCGADLYVDHTYDTLVNDNYQIITWGNAMKMDALMTNSGSLSFTSLDEALDAMPAGMLLYGHNFIWYQQQNQTYLKSLISPEVTIESSGGILDVITNGDFETGDLTGWMGWGNSSTRECSAEGAYEGNYGAVLVNPTDANSWSAQFCQDLPSALTVGTTYILRFKAKCSVATGQIQMCLQNPSDYSAEAYYNFDVGTGWVTCEHEFTVASNESLSRLCLNFGAVAATYYIDNVEFGEKKSGPTNYCDNGSFENGTDGWTLNSTGDGIEAVESSDAVDGSYVLQLKASASSANYWDLQITSPTMATFPGEQVRIAFYIKSDQAGAGRVSFSSDITNRWPWINWTGSQSSWTESFETGTGWTEINFILQNYSDDFADGSTTWSFCIDLGSVAGVTYYVDDVRVTLVSEEEEEEESSRGASPRKASTITYTFKSAEEKREILLDAMESWIKGVADHLSEKGVTPYGYDVINEPITDDSCLIRGVDDVFGGYTTDDDGNVTYDSEPTEDSTDGLTLNWGDSRFYWGYYVKDYAVKAFQYAREYLPSETKLFVNDYGLETSSGKLAALISFVNGIDSDNGSAIVDGIGTQMHITFSATDDEDDNATNLAALKSEVDEMFTTLANTGKLIRITELDVSLGTGSPSSTQYQAQSDVYQMIVEEYKAIIPSAQQSGITVWGVSDNDAEHEYWLNGQVPNLFDASYKRKWAYKGFCDGLYGGDIGLEFGSDAYKAYYERNNVSSTVDE